MSRQINTLARCYNLTVAGRSVDSLEGIESIALIPRYRKFMKMIVGTWLLKTNQFSRYYWNLADVRDAAQKLDGKQFDLIIANDVETLPLAFRIARGAKVLLDAHEYSPQEFDDRRIWRFFAQKYTHSYLCQDHLPKVDAMMTVCEGIAEEYEHHFHIPKPFVILNAPFLQHLEPKPCGEHIRLIHHGKAIPSRKLEFMVEMMEYLDKRFLLDIMLIEKNPDYLKDLKSISASNQRIRFIPPVAMLDIPKTINIYDIGIFLLPPVNINYTYALPNKFFEFIQARLAIAIGPSPEMARYVHHHDCGVVSRDFTPKQLAYELNRLTVEQINQYKQNAHKAAQKLCFEASEQILLKHVQELLTI